MAMNEHDLLTLGGLVSQVKAGARKLLDYFAQEDIPEKSTQQLTQIIDDLDALLKDLIEKAYGDLDERTARTLYHKGFAEWKDTLEALVRLTDHVTQTISLTHSPEIEEINKVLKGFLSAADEDPQERRQRAASILAKMGAKRVARLFIPQLESPDHFLRRSVCDLLSLCGDEEATIPLINVLHNDPDATTRILAAFALGKIGDPRAIPALRWAQQHDDGTDWEGRRVSDSAADAIEEILARHSSTGGSTVP